jgi:hypothetical protein
VTIVVKEKQDRTDRFADWNEDPLEILEVGTGEIEQANEEDLPEEDRLPLLTKRGGKWREYRERTVVRSMMMHDLQLRSRDQHVWMQRRTQGREKAQNNPQPGVPKAAV